MSSLREPSLVSSSPACYNTFRWLTLSDSTTHCQCNVSLVGQWIEEAKSKLMDPGSIYAYHGADRTRNPARLASNSIVVTTYETLASDASYHANKSKKTNYCPPCEQVRWWRIICDESHVLRNGSNKKSDAVLNLVADNKWLVSGTQARLHRPFFIFSFTNAFFLTQIFLFSLRCRNAYQYDCDGSAQSAQVSWRGVRQSNDGPF